MMKRRKRRLKNSGFSVKGAFEVLGAPGEQALITALCDKHAAKLADNHPDWWLKKKASFPGTWLVESNHTALSVK